MNKTLVISSTISHNSKNLKAALFISQQLKSPIWTPLNTSTNSAVDFPLITSSCPKKEEIPSLIQDLYHQITQNATIIFCVPEHNSNFSAYFKNIFDWLSVIDRSFLSNKAVVLASATDSKSTTRPISRVAEITFASVGMQKFAFLNWCNFGSTESEERISLELQQIINH